MTDYSETLNETRSLLRPNLIRRLKVIIRGLLSPVLGFSLSKNWETATAKSLGYESKSTLNSLKSGCKPGSTDGDPRAEVVVKHIFELISQIPTNRHVRVLDVGGGFGQYFFYTTRTINTHKFVWTVLETEGHCSIIPHELQTVEDLTFVSYLSEENQQFDIALLSGVIQCVEEPYNLLAESCARADAVIVNRLPLSTFDVDRVAVLRPGLLNSKGSYPVHIFSRNTLIQQISDFAEITSIWMVPQDSAVIHFKLVQHFGLVLKPIGSKASGVNN